MGNEMTVSDVIQIVLMGLLVVVTGVYAWRTHVISKATEKQAKATREQADASAKMAEEMRAQAEHMVNAEFNAVAPVVQLLAADSVTSDMRTVRIYWKNVGKGPALNFQCWIDDPENLQLRNLSKAINRTAVAVDTSTDKGDFSNFVEIDTGIENYRLQYTQACIRAQYKSVFGWTYESSLHFPPNAAPELKYGKAKEIIIL